MEQMVIVEDYGELEVAAAVGVVEHMVKVMVVASMVSLETKGQENLNPIEDLTGWGRMASPHSATTASQYIIILTSVLI